MTSRWGVGPYISSFPTRNTISETLLLGEANIVAPLLRFASSTATKTRRTWLQKDPPVVELIEEEEEEWPEAGVQNIKEAEQYVDQVNNMFDHLIHLNS